jgi:pyruvate ferredoxin oxidoreductase delta subunit
MTSAKYAEAKWRELPRGGVISNPGSAAEYETGDWRSQRPVWIKEHCINCLFCWIYCPDSAVVVKEGKFVEFDYRHCKGCGICAKECPAKNKAIEMISEAESPGK